MNLTEAEWDFYSDNSSEIIREFRSYYEPEELPENDEDLINWYGSELEELIKEWYEDYKESIRMRSLR